MSWTVTLKESVSDDLRSFGRKDARLLLDEAEARLAANPLEQSRSMKTLRPNPVAERELRLFGEYRVLFKVNQEQKQVTVILVGEKRGNALFVRGQEFRAHHDSDPAE